MKKIIILFLALLIPSSVIAKNIEYSCCDGVYHFVLTGNSIKRKISFVQNDCLITNKEIHQKYKSKFTINAGFFDPKNQKTISYIVTNKKITANPEYNESLMNSKELQPYLDKVLNRSELRVVKCGLKYSYQIAQHSEPVEKGCKIITSAQGGPQILPELNLEEEFFILRKDGKVVRQSAAVLFRAARTIVGIKDGDLHVVIIPMEHPKTMREVQKICKDFGFEKAMAFDGGSSTSLNYQDIDLTSTYTENGRKLKSFMIVK